MNTKKGELEVLNAVVTELRTMQVGAARAENRAHTRMLASQADPDELLHHEWLLGRFSGLSEALAYVEGVVDYSNLRDCGESQEAIDDDS